jgi:hypothetical protein
VRGSGVAAPAHPMTAFLQSPWGLFCEKDTKEKGFNEKNVKLPNRYGPVMHNIKSLEKNAL